MAHGITLYHNPRCSKSRQTLALLQEHGARTKIVLYLETPPSETALADLVKKLGITPRDLLRKGEDAYKQLGLADPQLSDAEILKAMATHPKLIERPIAIKGNRAVLGRPPENVVELL